MTTCAAAAASQLPVQALLKAGNATVARMLDGGGTGTALGGPAPPPAFLRALAASGSGQPLLQSLREEAETRLGTGLPPVTVHTDPGAGAAARIIGARAFTVGTDVYVAPGHYRPQEPDGRRLLVHELAHVAQAGAAPAAAAWLSDPDGAAEREAHAVAAQVAPGAAARAHVRTGPGGVHRDPDPAVAQLAASDAGAAERAADRVWSALDGWDDEAAAIQALTGHDGPTRERLKQHFRATHHVELAAYLQDQLDGQDLVRATALLSSSHTHDHHTQLALALFGAGTRDDELRNVLSSLPLAGRREVERRYDQVFGAIGRGSLKADLADDLSGWELQKALALLHRDLTPADHLYFHSVAIAGTHDDAVVQAVQDAWSGGPARIRALHDDWRRLVNNADGWTTTAWTKMSLRAAMEDELSGEALELVQAVLRQYEQLGPDAGAEAGPLALEEARLGVARATLTAATTGGYTGAGTNEAQVFRSVTEIRAVWEERLHRVAGTPEEPLQRSAWERERAGLLTQVVSEMDEGSADHQRTRLLLSGALTPADEVYLAKVDLDSDKVVDLVSKTWASGQVEQLLTQAATERRDDRGSVLRPAFDPLLAVPVTSGLPWRRVATLVRTDQPDDARGAERLSLELEQDDSDAALRRAYDLVKDAAADLRLRTITRYAASSLRDTEGAGPVEKFLSHVQRRYAGSTTCFDLADLLDPAQSTRTRLERAEGRTRASHTGALDSVLTGAADAYGAMTGEQTGQVAQESLDRLRFIAQHEQADDGELDAMAAVLGRPKADLAKLEYDAFQSRLRELRDLRQGVVDAFATAIEVVVSAAITIATGGAAGGLLLASLGSALAGMAMRESLQGVDYEFTSDENAQRIVVELAAAGLGAFGANLAKGIGTSAEAARLARTQFLRGALQDGLSAVGRTAGEAAFSGRMPTAESIAATALATVGGAAGGGAGRVAGHGAEELSEAAQRLRRNVSAAMTTQLVTGMSEEAASLARTGVGDQTAAQIAGRFARRGASGLVTGMVSGAADTAAQRRPDAGPPVLEPDPSPPSPDTAPSPAASSRVAAVQPVTSVDLGGTAANDNAVGPPAPPEVTPIGRGRSYPRSAQSRRNDGILGGQDPQIRAPATMPAVHEQPAQVEQPLALASGLEGVSASVSPAPGPVRPVASAHGGGSGPGSPTVMGPAPTHTAATSAATGRPGPGRPGASSGAGRLDPARLAALRRQDRATVLAREGEGVATAQVRVDATRAVHETAARVRLEAEAAHRDAVAVQAQVAQDPAATPGDRRAAAELVTEAARAATSAARDEQRAMVEATAAASALAGISGLQREILDLNRRIADANLPPRGRSMAANDAARAQLWALRHRLEAAKKQLVRDIAGLERSIDEQVEAASPGAAGRPAAEANAATLGLVSPAGPPLDVTTGAPMTPADVATYQVDHVVPRAEIRADPRFLRLTPSQRDHLLLRIPENYLPLTAAANNHKGDWTVDEWIANRPATARIPDTMVAKLRAADTKARTAVQAAFERFLGP